jgi:hypothetical protein
VDGGVAWLLCLGTGDGEACVRRLRRVVVLVNRFWGVFRRVRCLVECSVVGGVLGCGGPLCWVGVERGCESTRCVFAESRGGRIILS